MRRFATIALSLSLVLGISAAGRLFAQDEKKDAPKADAAQDATKPQDAPKAGDAKKDENKKDENKKEEPKKDEAKKEEAKPAESAPPPIPPEVEAKLEAARRAVAEAIVAAQDAGLVNTSIDPPPILDILLTGRADDAAVLKAAVDNKENPEAGLSPEVFGAWFTGFGKMSGVDKSLKNVRIMNPDKGLTDWYRTRAAVVNRHLDAVRKAKGEAPKPAETKGEAPTAKDDQKKDDQKKDDQKKPESPK